MFQIKNHRDSLTDIALSQAVGKVATCGDNTLKVHSLQNLEETETLITVTNENGISSIEWSTDGTMLAVVTYIGNVLIYLIEIPKLTSVCGNRIALLTSLMEVAVHLYTLDKVPSTMQSDKVNFFTRSPSCFQDKPSPQIINTIIEPAILAVGPVHLAVGLNNRALFWDLSTNHYNMHFERDYLATIDSMRLNETYVSALFDGKLQLHSVITSFEFIVRIPQDGLANSTSCAD